MAGQVWAVNTLGGYMFSLELSDTLRTAVQPLVKFRQFCDANDFTDKGLHKGQLFTWNVFSDVATQGTTLTETTTMPETNFTVAQGTGTVAELGNSVPYTGFLDDMSKQPVQEIIRKVLKNDAKKSLDTLAYNQFNATPLRVCPATNTTTDAVTLTTNGTCTLTNSVAFGKNHVKAIGDLMKERNIPPYMGDDYFAIARPTTWRQMKNDLESVHQYTDQGFMMILNGEIGRYEGFRFIEQTNIASAAWSVAKSDPAFFFGEDTVAEALCIPEEIRGKIPGDYGRARGVAWYYEGGFSIVQTQASQARIVKWDSAQ
jgi:N4-gp56 family major capsid protein